MPKLCC